MFSRSLFVLLSFFFWPLCCLFFLYIRILIAPLVSSNASYIVSLGYLCPFLIIGELHFWFKGIHEAKNSKQNRKKIKKDQINAAAFHEEFVLFKTASKDGLHGDHTGVHCIEKKTNKPSLFLIANEIWIMNIKLKICCSSGSPNSGPYCLPLCKHWARNKEHGSWSSWFLHLYGS
jgi:hypothetical protein